MSKPEQMKIAIIGGTGNLGFGLAVRLAKAYEVTIGSRDLPRAADAAAKAGAIARVRVEAKANRDAARACDIAILAVPDLPSADLFESLAPNLAEKLVISPIVPMVFKEGVFSLSHPEESAAERVAKALPRSKVAGAFHTVPAPKLTQPDAALDYDVLVTADSRDVFGLASRVVSSIGKLRPLYAGPLTVSRMVEAMTPALLNVSRLNKIDSPSIKLV
jgi:8-hydroxy-5-deazaflavin:NADPH oxidoreductase